MRPNTIRTQESLCYHWIHGRLELDGSNLDECLKLWQSRLAPSTVKSLLYLAKECVWADKGIKLDIKAHLRTVARSKQQLPVTALSQSEIIALTRTCKASDQKLYLPFMLSLHTGMRRGECWGLTWGDVDILNNRILISKSYKGPTKSGKSRIVPISSALEKVLLAHMPLKTYNYTEPLLKSFDPNPRLKKICKEAGVRENITFHALRHTFATLALEAGRSPALVSRTLGHSKVSTTLDIYWSSSKESIDLEFLPS